MGVIGPSLRHQRIANSNYVVTPSGGRYINNDVVNENITKTVKVNGVDTRKENRNLYFEEVCKYAIDAGMCPVLWDITNHVYHRENAKMIYEDEAQSFLLLAKQSKEKEPYRYSE